MAATPPGPLLVSGGIPVAAALLRTGRSCHDNGEWDDEAHEGGDVTGANALLMPAKAAKKRKNRVVVPEIPTTRMERRMSKSKARKLANVEVKRAKKAKRGEVIESLKANRLTLEQAALMQRSGGLGQRVTKKQAATRDAAMARVQGKAPAPRAAPDPYAYTRPAAAVTSSSSDSEGWSEDSDESEDEAPAPAPRPAPVPFSVRPATPELKPAAAPVPPPLAAVAPPAPPPAPSAAPVAKATAPMKPRVVMVARPAAVQEQRMQLPVCQMEQEVMEVIGANDVVILCGETGSGKTTQVPQFLYEAGYGSTPGRSGMIGVTQPRRVAAIAMAQRVAAELGVTCGRGGAVAHQIRYDSSGVGKHTKVKFMTDGILLREIQEDLLLRKYSVLIIDEAHERNVNTDILIGLLSRAVPLRNALAAQDPGSVSPLKLIVMSATLRVEDFTGNTRMFPIAPPVINVQARQYPVTTHFSKRTELVDYVGDALKKVSAIHRKLPDGGVLVFLTGQDEIVDLCTRLRKRFQVKRAAKATPSVAAPESGGDSTSDDEDDATKLAASLTAAAREEGPGAAAPAPAEGEEDEADSEIDVDDVIRTRVEAGEEGAITGKTPKAQKAVVEAKVARLMKVLEERAAQPLHIVPLYSLLSKAEQMRVFRPPPPGHRLVVVATNVAETSLTIPGIRYVVDCGRAKQRQYNLKSGTSTFVVDWISKASAEQRTGRAGRTGPGHCYRQYSSAVFERFPLFDEPEVLRMPIDGIVLQLKSMGISHVSQFPFPTPPPAASLRASIDSLLNLNALTRVTNTSSDGTVTTTEALTPLGVRISGLPLLPRLAVMLLKARELGVLPHVIAVVAAMTAQNPLLRPSSAKAPGASSSVKNATADTVVDEPSDSDVSEYEEEDSEEGEGEEESVAKDTARRAAAAARAAHAKWAHPTSDALALLALVTEYSNVVAAAGTGAKEASWKWCKENYVRHKTMSEISQLTQQLRRMFPEEGDSVKHSISSGDAVEVDDAIATHTAPEDALTLSMLTPSQEHSVLLCVLSGLVDRVARKAPLQEDETRDVGKSWKRSKSAPVPYLACSSSTPGVLFVHPMSNVYTQDGTQMPGYVVFNEVVVSKRSYMRGVTAIDPTALPALTAGSPLCRVGPPLDTPPPYYDADVDDVMCMVAPSYGDRAWLLPAVAASFPAGEDKCRWFGRYLLEGRVLPALKAFKPACQPSILTHKAPQRRCAVLLGALSGGGEAVTSKATLAARLRAQPAFLRDVIQMWAAKGGEAAAVALWNSAVAQLLAEHRS